MEPLERKKLYVDMCATVLTMLAVVLGGGWALFEYVEKHDAERVKETLEYVERFQTSPVVDASQRIARVWTLHDAEVEAKAKLGGKEYTRFVMDTIEREKIGSDVLHLVGFYQQLKMCVDGELCDARAAKAFFCGEAKDFFAMHARYINAKRDLWRKPSLGIELESFAKKDCGLGKRPRDD